MIFINYCCPLLTTHLSGSPIIHDGRAAWAEVRQNILRQAGDADTNVTSATPQLAYGLKYFG